MISREAVKELGQAPRSYAKPLHNATSARSQSHFSTASEIRLPNRAECASLTWVQGNWSRWPPGGRGGF